MDEKTGDYKETEECINRKLEEKETSACEKLDYLRSNKVALDQKKATYFRRPCIRDWPCFYFTQHRSEIDKIKERLVPIEQRLSRECSVEIYSRETDAAARSLSTTSTSSQNSSADNRLYNVQGDLNLNVSVNPPKINP